MRCQNSHMMSSAEWCTVIKEAGLLIRVLAEHKADLA